MLLTPGRQYATSVSGGEAQRIALARVLLARRPVVVLDEQAANVDEPTADAILRTVLAEARDTGTSVLVISHIPVPADLVTHRVALAPDPAAERASAHSEQ